ncbi:MAG: FecR domain-containing protein [Pseudomonadota bacterium]
MSPEGPEFPIELRNRALEWRILIDAGQIEPDERQAFEAWLSEDPRHEQAFDQATTVWDAYGTLNNKRVRPEFFRASVIDQIRGVLADARWPRWSIGTGSATIAGLASTAAIAVFMVPNLNSSPQSVSINTTAEVTVYSTKIGETRIVNLPDGSALTLGPATSIEVAFSEVSRTVKMHKGAVIFDVERAPSRPFTVKAEQFEASVLGTVFDVRSNGGVVRLSVAEGSVEVKHPFILDAKPSSLMNSHTLSVGQNVEATSNKGLSSIRSFEVDSFAAWRDNRLRYNNATLAELIADANRYSDVPITIENDNEDIASLTVTFGYHAEDVDNMLASLPVMFPVAIDRAEENHIVIRAIE